VVEVLSSNPSSKTKQNKKTPKISPSKQQQNLFNESLACARYVKDNVPTPRITVSWSMRPSTNNINLVV
jgi:hypothetical protein